MRTAVAIAIAGALGALARYGLDGFVTRRAPGAFPWGTFVVNVTGAFVLGFVFTLMTEQLTTAPWLRSALTIGFLGAYTTFSTLSFETYRLIEDGARRARRREHARQLRRRAVRGLPRRRRRRERYDALEGEGKLLRLFIGESDTLARQAALPGDRRARPQGGPRRSDRAARHRGVRRRLAPPHLAHPPALRGPAGRDRDRRHAGADRPRRRRSSTRWSARGCSRSSACRSSRTGPATTSDRRHNGNGGLPARTPPRRVARPARPELPARGRARDRAHRGRRGGARDQPPVARRGRRRRAGSSSRSSTTASRSGSAARCSRRRCSCSASSSTPTTPRCRSSARSASRRSRSRTRSSPPTTRRPRVRRLRRLGRGPARGRGRARRLDPRARDPRRRVHRRAGGAVGATSCAARAGSTSSSPACPRIRASTRAAAKAKT